MRNVLFLTKQHDLVRRGLFLLHKRVDILHK